MTESSTSQIQVKLHVPAMCCSAEVSELEKAFRLDARVAGFSSNTINRTITLRLNQSITEDTGWILSRIADCGMTSELLDCAPMHSRTSGSVTIRIPAMDCPVEQGQIQNALTGHPSVRSMKFNLSERTLSVELTDHADTAGLLATLQAIGLPGEILNQGKQDKHCFVVNNARNEADAKHLVKIAGQNAEFNVHDRILTVKCCDDEVLPLLSRLQAAGWEAELHKKPQASADKSVNRRRWIFLLIALLLAFTAEVGELTHWFSEVIIAAMAIVAIILAGVTTLIQGARNLLRFNFNMKTLMAVAVTGACALKAWPEAAMVMSLFEIGEAIESLSMTRARHAIKSLLSSTPTEVTVNINGQWQRMPVDLVPTGVHYRVEPGERCGLDGVVIEGAGGMDESMITGESLPVTKNSGDRVWAGALALEAGFIIKATSRSTDSMSARIIRAVEEAEQKKAPLQRFVDKFAARYTPTVFGIAIAVAIFGPILTDLSITDWIYRALVLLVIACPCALVISTPVTIVSALALAARRGILIKGGVYLEQARTLKVVALDKTGTVTRGEPRFTKLILTSQTAEKQVWSLAGSLACMSSHPVSKAIANHLHELKITPELVRDFKAIPGMGTQGRINQATLRLTNLKWLEENLDVSKQIREAFAYAYERGMTAVALSDIFGVIAVFIVSDTLKENAARAIEAMHACELKTVLLTGDNARAAHTIAQTVGIDVVKAELLPEQKLEQIDALEKMSPTAMVGDGINDAPALTRARIGFAMGIKGANTAIESADIALMDDDIGKIAWLKQLSELTHTTLVTNILFALAIKFMFALAALFGHATMWMAVFADTGVCIIVVAWGLRLIKCGKVVDRMLAHAVKRYAVKSHNG